MLQGTKRIIALGVLALLLALPGQALAQSSTEDPYDDSSITVVGGGNPSDPGDPADPGDPGSSTSSASSLPFSGLDVGLLAAAGGALLLFGIGMRRLTRRPDPA